MTHSDRLPLSIDALRKPYSITSPAAASRVVGMVRPSILAVLRLIARSYFVGACTGRSAAFSPLRIARVREGRDDVLDPGRVVHG